MREQIPVTNTKWRTVGWGFRIFRLGKYNVYLTWRKGEKLLLTVHEDNEAGWTFGYEKESTDN